MKGYEFYYTQDGSIGLYSHSDGDVYHSKYGALTEAWEKFVLPSGLDKLINTKDEINVLDVCYGVGYNTKALISYILNKDENLLRKKNFFIKIFKTIINKIKNKKNEKNNNKNSNIESIDNYNIKEGNLMLSKYIETNDKDNIISKFNIDCLDINEELVKISPFLKTVFTPQEIFTQIVPKVFKCFDTYWIIRNKLSKFALKIALKNKKSVTELLDLKYNNDYDLLEHDYKIHKYANYIIINTLIDKYRDKYIDEDMEKILNIRSINKFFSKSHIRYAKCKQDYRYKFMSKLNLFTFLHNIYYNHLSIRYKDVDFKASESLIKLNFMVNDARKSILEIQKQYDIMFLDAFTYSKAPELWTVEFIAELYKKLKSRGILITYSNSALIRNTLLENKFYLGKIIDAKTGKSIGTIAAKDKSLIKEPLSNYEIGLCNTRAGIPYHDKNLSQSRDDILAYREYDFKYSNKLTSTQYMRSRLSKK
ncbi:MAG: MnmC family methyltransferase [bacterium]|nr:MnmC family methyltransferase [bacterium]